MRDRVDFPEPLAPIRAGTSLKLHPEDTPCESGFGNRCEGIQQGPPAGLRSRKVFLQFIGDESTDCHITLDYPKERDSER